jgi:FMN phosphatase YigB (HAD superfamily)
LTVNFYGRIGIIELGEVMHLSFDFWNTLASANPLYTQARTKFLSRISGLPPEIVKQVYTSVKTRLDNEASEQGKSTPCRDNYTTLVNELVAQGGRGLSGDSVVTVMVSMEQMFRDLPPLIPESMAFLLNRAHRLGYTLSVASNTNFIRGDILSESLRDIPFDFMLFSDEIEVSKPHNDFARSIQGMVNHLYRGAGRSSLTHVGDNEICDGTMRGIPFQYVKNPQDTVQFLEKL